MGETRPLNELMIICKQISLRSAQCVCVITESAFIAIAPRNSLVTFYTTAQICDDRSTSGYKRLTPLVLRIGERLIQKVVEY